MYQFHKDKSKYFQIQYKVTEEHVYPFLLEQMDMQRTLRVMEIGCAEAGVLKYFLEQGHHCTGIELSPSRTKLAVSFLKEEIQNGMACIINKNVFDIDLNLDLGGRGFDLIIMKDVIEHIPDKDVFFKKLIHLLNDEGKIFFAFPPWQMPFGGHQQVCKSIFLNKLPWVHLLPKLIYRQLLKGFGESKETVKELLELKDTGLSISSFHKQMKSHSFKIMKETYWMINPIYKYKFGLSPRKFKSRRKFLGDFYTSCMYSLVSI